MPDQKEKATGRVNDQQPDAPPTEMNVAPQDMAPPAPDVKREEDRAGVELAALFDELGKAELNVEGWKSHVRWLEERIAVEKRAIPGRRHDVR